MAVDPPRLSFPPISLLQSPPPISTPSSPSRPAKPSPKPKPSSHTPAAHPWIAAVVGWVPLIDPASVISSTASPPTPLSKAFATSSRPSPMLYGSHRLQCRPRATPPPQSHLRHPHPPPPASRRHPPRRSPSRPGLRPRSHRETAHPQRENFSPGRATSSNSPAVPMFPASFPASSPKPTTPAWNYEQIVPYLEAALAAFTPARLMFGSDWPVCRVATTYLDWVRTVERFAASLSAAEREALFHSSGRPRLSPHLRIIAGSAFSDPRGPNPHSNLQHRNHLPSDQPFRRLRHHQKSIRPAPRCQIPDPCHAIRCTRAPRTSLSIRAGRKRVSPAFTRTSSSSRAIQIAARNLLSPPSARNSGAANSANVTMVEIGFPGSPKK